MSAYDGDGHVRMSLGLYALGALHDDLYPDVEEHLSGCAACDAELRRLNEVTFALARLSTDDARELAGVAAGAEAHQPVRRGGVRSPGPLAGAGHGPPSTRSPSAGPPGGSPPDASAGRAAPRLRKRLAKHARMAALAAVFALVIGIGLGVYLQPDQDGTTAVATAAATADDTAAGATMSITVYTKGDGASVRATIAGLRPDYAYRLSVHTLDGQAHLVRQWSSPDGAQAIVVDLAVPPSSMAYFTVTQQDGIVVMLAQCRRGPSSASSPSPGG